jgi:hypothetical protein
MIGLFRGMLYSPFQIPQVILQGFAAYFPSPLLTEGVNHCAS